MKSIGDNTWSGTAFDAEDGQRYSGKMTPSGDHLVTAGCVAGGLICKSFSWTRAREWSEFDTWRLPGSAPLDG